MISRIRPVRGGRRAPLWLFLFCVLFAAPLRAQGVGTVRGEVRSDPEGTPLAAATVEIVDGRGDRAALSGANGRYRLSEVPAGRRTIRASHPGHLPFEIELIIPAGSELELDLVLRERTVSLAPMVVRHDPAASERDSVPAPRPALELADTRAADGGPGMAEIGLAEAARNPDGGEPAGPSDMLYVRGAAADLKLVLLDGAPVYAPFHMGGLIESFDPNALTSVDVYLGGAPARYDGGLAYILDLRTRGGRLDRTHAAASVDLLSATARVEGPVGRGASVRLGGRAVGDFGVGPLLGAPLPYRYADGLARIDVPVGERGVLSATGFANRESVRLDALGNGDGRSEWGNVAGSLRFRGWLGQTETELSAAASRFGANLPLGSEQPLLLGGSAGRLRLAADLARSAGPVQLRFGGGYDRQRIRYTRDYLSVSENSAVAAGDRFGAYLDAGWQVLPRLRLRGGMRSDLFFGDGNARFGPRLSATWILGERAALSLAAGRYHQYVRREPVTVLPDAEAPTPFRMLRGMGIASASHVSLLLDQDMGEGIRFGVEGFYKRFDDLPASVRDQARASGMDVWVRRDAGTVTGWLGYSLAWVWSAAPDPGAVRSFEGRHLLSSGIAAPLGPHGRLALRFTYGAGLPYTGIPIGESFEEVGVSAESDFGARTADEPPLAPELDETFVRLDLRASRTWTGSWNGNPFQVTPYLRVLNALDQRDALFFYRDPERGEAQPVSALPLVPVLGVEWRF